MKSTFGCVVKVIEKSDPLWNCPEAQKAFEDEVFKVKEKFKIADFHDPKEWSQIAASQGPDEKVGLKMILGIKSFEMPRSFWRFKARACATGNYVESSSGWQCFEDPDSLVGKPADMTAARLSMIQTLSTGGDLEQADAQSAYCQAPIKGSPKWLSIPRSLRKVFGIPEDMTMPVCRMRRALYGLQRSSFDWQSHAEEKLQASGWRNCWRGGQGVFHKVFHGQRVLLTIYVDYLIVGGLARGRKAAWAELGELLMLDPPEPLSKFLGVHH